MNFSSYRPNHFLARKKAKRCFIVSCYCLTEKTHMGILSYHTINFLERIKTTRCFIFPCDCLTEKSCTEAHTERVQRDTHCKRLAATQTGCVPVHESGSCAWLAGRLSDYGVGEGVLVVVVVVVVVVLWGRGKGEDRRGGGELQFLRADTVLEMLPAFNLTKQQQQQQEQQNVYSTGCSASQQHAK